MTIRSELNVSIKSPRILSCSLSLSCIAIVPITARDAKSKTSEIFSSVLSPPATCKGIDVFSEIFLMVLKFSPVPKVASKSTICNMSPPSDSHFFAISTGLLL